MVGCDRTANRSSAAGRCCWSSLTGVSELRKISHGASAPEGGGGSNSQAADMEKLANTLSETVSCLMRLRGGTMGGESAGVFGLDQGLVFSVVKAFRNSLCTSNTHIYHQQHQPLPLLQL